MKPPTLAFRPEDETERRLLADQTLLTGLAWGRPRRGHPEGAVGRHVAEVLANLERLDLPPDMRRRLRFAAFVHDSLKFRIDTDKPRTPPNEHGYQASRFAAAYTTDKALLTLIELHDEGYRAWRAHDIGNTADCERRLALIAARVGHDIGPFMAFYWADNQSGDKEQGQLAWFAQAMSARGVACAVPVPVR
jgi:hypothetical protein